MCACLYVRANCNTIQHSRTMRAVVVQTEFGRWRHSLYIDDYRFAAEKIDSRRARHRAGELSVHVQSADEVSEP